MKRKLLLIVFAMTVGWLSLVLVGVPHSAARSPEPPAPSDAATAGFAVYTLYLREASDAGSRGGSPFDRLRPLLMALQAKGQVLSVEWQPERGMVRLVATEAVATDLLNQPEVVQIDPAPVRMASRPGPRPATVPHAPAVGIIEATGTYTISGIVRDYDGTVMSGVWVRTDSDDPVYEWDFTDTDGSYSLQVIPGPYHVSAYESGLPAPPDWLASRSGRTICSMATSGGTAPRPPRMAATRFSSPPAFTG